MLNWQGKTMLGRNLISLAVLICTACLTEAGESVITVPPSSDRAMPLPFWEIGLSNFKTEKPRLVVLPSKSGREIKYWSWRFRFRPITNLAAVKKYLQKMSETASDIDIQGQGTSPRAFYQRHLERLESTEASLRDKTFRLPVNFSGEPGGEPLQLGANVFIVIHADNGQIVPDTANPAVRNYIENKDKTRLYTTADIRASGLFDLEINPASKMVEAVAIFPRLDPNVRTFEIRVYGMGYRFNPRYQPGELLFFGDDRNPKTDNLANIKNASLRRAYRFSYRRTGVTGEDHIDNISLEQKRADWVWVWPSRIYMGKFRKLIVDRVSGLKREYRYLPYRVWNNTTSPQDLRITQAGMNFYLNWRGHPIRLRMYDIGDADDFWKTQVERTVKASVTSGESRIFAEANEHAGFQKGTDEETADLDAKGKIIPTGTRHVRKILDPMEIAKGLIIIRWGPEEVTSVVNKIATDLYSQALVGKSRKDDGLYAKYQELRPAVPENTPAWKRLPEPDKGRVIKMLVDLAREDLQARNIEVSDDQKRRYHKLAPIGALLTALASERAQKRAAENSTVDVFFEVEWDRVVDRCAFPVAFNRPVPKKRLVPKPPSAELELQTGGDAAITAMPGLGDDDDGDEGEEGDDDGDGGDGDGGDGGEDVLPW